MLHVSKAIRHSGRGVVFRVRQDASSTELYGDLVGKVNSLEFKSLIYVVILAPAKYAEYLQSSWDTINTVNTYY